VVFLGLLLISYPANLLLSQPRSVNKEQTAAGAAVTLTQTKISVSLILKCVVLIVSHFLMGQPTSTALLTVTTKFLVPTRVEIATTLKEIGLR